MNKPTTAVVEQKWLDKVQTLLGSIKDQIKETGAPVRPGHFKVELNNSTEVDLHSIIRDFKIHDAVEKAVDQMTDDMRRLAKIGAQVVAIIEKEKANEPDPAEG